MLARIVSSSVLIVIATASTVLADGHLPAAGGASGSYDFFTGRITINATEVVNVFVESAGSLLTPGDTDAAPAGILVSDNASRVGLTGFTGVTVKGWTSHNTRGISNDDLSLVVGPALGEPAVAYRCEIFGQFSCVPSRIRLRIPCQP